ncbi:MAG: hypoxanthine phosphoribosyltransferase [Chloroflexota bacterium]
MALTKEREYYKATCRAAAVVNSSAPANEQLDTIVRATARCMKSGVSILLLDSTKTKLIHNSSWGLPKYFLRKGLLDACKSLAEVLLEQPVFVPDISKDKRIQYPDFAAKAGIVSVLGVPIMQHDSAVGSIRVYSGNHREFTDQDIAFVTAMANMSALALDGALLSQQLPIDNNTEGTGSHGAQSLRQLRSVTFAHPSEKDFASILDFYGIEWVYEPRSFPLRQEGGRVTEMFTPDFYLPGLDLYVELTTMRQSLVTRKNRKLRHLKELYPDVKITLLYKNDYQRLLAKYGTGPLSQTRAHGISRVLYSADEIADRVQVLAQQISKDYAGRHPLLLGIQRGFLCFMADLIRRITIPLDVDFLGISYYDGSDNAAVKITKDMDLSVTGRHVIVVEDIIDTGITLSYILSHLRERQPVSVATCTLLDRRVRRLADVHLNYVGFEVPDEFVVGYGLDYREEYRNLPFIGIPVLKKENSKEGKPKSNKLKVEEP